MVLKTKTNLLAALTVALALTACSSDSDQQTSAREIRLFTEVAGSTRAADDADALQDTQLASGTKITVKVKENASTTSVDYPLTTYTADGLGGLSLPEGVKQYYPANGNGVNIYAFHPMGAVQTFAVQTDQTTDAAYKASDLMWASLSDITAESTPAQRTLAFDHLLSKIVVTIQKATGFSETDLATATVTLGNDNLITSGAFTASTGIFTPAASGTGTITLATNAGAATYTAIVVPQSILGKKINLTIGEVSSSYSILTTKFEPGKRYTYVLIVGYSGSISLVKSEITDWQNEEIIKSL
jgi:hypothetical protein